MKEKMKKKGREKGTRVEENFSLKTTLSILLISALKFQQLYLFV